MDNVFFHRFPTNDAWCRDHGPIFVQRNTPHGREEAIIDWGYNAWGGKYPPYDLDDQIPTLVGQEYGIRVFHPGIVMEGGAVDFNGAGTVLTTTSCLLNKNRNPRLSQGFGGQARAKRRIEKYLRNLFRLDTITVIERPQADSVEVHIGGEFIGVIFKDEEDGEVSYAFNMAILEMDLPQAPPSRS